MWILYNRKSSKPARLNLRAGKKTLPDIVKKTKNTGREKNLDCLFMYNGHEFNAYEVLGIPGGASIQMAEEAFQTLKNAKGQEHDFYLAALNAIKQS
ncbi:MAG: hypothetical protein KDD37_11260 [Bdellovibrionales bacterium]|nr:hypothetical protein [Bdellovibrionales bacterium]